MAPVINLASRKRRDERRVLVLAGLHQSGEAVAESDSLTRVLENCRLVLAQAKFFDIPVAFVRCIAPPSSVSEPRTYPAWFKRLEPTRDDMIFDVMQASCYSNAEFAQAMEYTQGNFAMAGLFAETTCLATAIDAHHRRHGFTYLSDASACRNNGTIPAGLFHSAVSQVMSLYGDVMESQTWRLAQSPIRRLR